MAKLKNDTTVITNEVRFSYAHVFEPESINGSEPKYSVSIIIDKKDKDTLKAIKEAIDNAKKLGAAKFGGKVPANVKIPLRDGDIDREDDEVYAGGYFLNANCKTKPTVIYKNAKPIEDTTDFYSGCFGKAAITFYAFNTNGNKGIACGLNNLLKTKDGEPLGGRSRATDDFADDIEKDEIEDDFLN